MVRLRLLIMTEETTEQVRQFPVQILQQFLVLGAVAVVQDIPPFPAVHPEVVVVEMPIRVLLEAELPDKALLAVETRIKVEVLVAEQGQRDKPETTRMETMVVPRYNLQSLVRLLIMAEEVVVVLMRIIQAIFRLEVRGEAALVDTAGITILLQLLELRKLVLVVVLEGLETAQLEIPERRVLVVL